jgi:hypothetical protein
MSKRNQNKSAKDTKNEYKNRSMGKYGEKNGKYSKCAMVSFRVQREQCQGS